MTPRAVTPDLPEHLRHWPPAGLVLRTPRLELRPDDDAGLAALADRAIDGVHPPEEMPFVEAWTDGADTPGFARGILQYAWRCRAEIDPARWQLTFLVREDGRVLGMQTLSATDFAVVREVRTGSWLTLAAQGRGIGTEMRHAVIALAFDHLGAVGATTEAFADNPASLGVNAHLGYVDDGRRRVARRGSSAELRRARLDPDHWRRPDWTLAVDGLGPCREMLGAPGHDQD